jgi:hypothetical protein
LWIDYGEENWQPNQRIGESEGIAARGARVADRMVGRCDSRARFKPEWFSQKFEQQTAVGAALPLPVEKEINSPHRRVARALKCKPQRLAHKLGITSVSSSLLEGREDEHV